MTGEGYEDWYAVEDYAALGTLNHAAVDAAHLDAHDLVAHAAGFGTGGLYAYTETSSPPALTLQKTHEGRDS